MTEAQLGIRHSALGTRREEYPGAREFLPTQVLEAGRYAVRFARTAEDLDRILRLRYRIFNLELGEGLDEAHRTGRDEDELDARFHHLMIVSRESGDVVGTYRMQTAEMAARNGFYSSCVFDLSTLPGAMREAAVEIGRACVAREHRNGRVLQLLWRGLAAYLSRNRKTWLFGCCSLTSQDPGLGVSVHRELVESGVLHPGIRIFPRPECACGGAEPGAPLPAPHVPALFRAYLALGAKVCGPPAIDRVFKTIDWLVALNVEQIDPATHRTFFR